MTAPTLVRTGPPVAAGAREMRSFTVSAQVRADGDGATLDGYASITDHPYAVSDWLGDYLETIQRGAFKKTLAEKDDVRLLFDHGGIPLARTSSSTLELEEDDTGLHVVSTLDRRSSLANDICVAMERGDLTEMSFAFTVPPKRATWSDDYTERDIFEVKLFDVSVVTYPANPATTAKLRSASPVDVLEQMGTDDLAALVARAQRRLDGGSASTPLDPTAALKFRAAYAL